MRRGGVKSSCAAPCPGQIVDRNPGAGGLSFVFGSTRRLECVYSPIGNYPSERYTGEIDKFGVDIGYVESGVIIWAVLAPSHSVSRGALSGTYVGVSADVAAGAGLSQVQLKAVN